MNLASAQMRKAVSFSKIQAAFPAPKIRTEDTMKKDIKLGRYRHFKGKEYEVLHIARHSETLEDMVVYRALYGEKGIWVRPASMWDELVAVDGRFVPRFQKEDGYSH